MKRLLVIALLGVSRLGVVDDNRVGLLGWLRAVGSELHGED